MAEYQIRYVLYAKSQGRTPEDQLEYDKQEYIGGHMCGFMLWIQGKWGVFKKNNKVLNNYTLSDEEHAKFNEWLEENL